CALSMFVPARVTASVAGSRLRRSLAVGAVALAASSGVLSARPQAPGGAELSATLERIGGQVAKYYARARSVICIETVILQPLTSSFSFDGLPRVLKYETRLEWEPASVEDREV